MTYLSTKTYGHETGLSAVFRQPTADSHCNQLHGYALGFKFVFEAKRLDENNWVMDFGGLKLLKKYLETYFDHKLVVSKFDPMLNDLLALQDKGLADVVILDGVGCEKFAELGHMLATQVIKELAISDRVRVVSAECSEHGANSAIYEKRIDWR